MAKVPPVWLIQIMLKMGVNLPINQEKFPDNWECMTGNERYELLSKSFISTEGREFNSQRIEKTYKRRAQRWVSALENKKPDRVPNFIIPEGYVIKYGGISEKDAWYNSKKSLKAMKKFQKAFNLEYSIITPIYSGRAFDILSLITNRWPGSKVPEQSLRPEQSYQFVEGEYMLAEEYSYLINSPTEYMLTRYLPRICTGLQGMSFTPSLVGPTTVASMPTFLMPYASGSVKQSIKKLFKAADRLIYDMVPTLIGSLKMTSQYGTPSPIGGMGIAPFDIIGDTMRGTRGVMVDMYRCPDKLLEACKSLTPAAIKMATSNISVGMSPFVLIPLHKGGDDFMSMEQFEKFYWSSYREFILGILEAGMFPISFAEGNYNKRLDFLADKYANGEIPSGRTAWLFEKTDMKAAKDKIGKYSCIGGNVPVSLFTTNSAENIDEYCRNLIETCANDGGFILAPGAVLMDSKESNFRNYLLSTKKYGVYNTVTQKKEDQEMIKGPSVNIESVSTA